MIDIAEISMHINGKCQLINFINKLRIYISNSSIIQFLLVYVTSLLYNNYINFVDYVSIKQSINHYFSALHHKVLGHVYIHIIIIIIIIIICKLNRINFINIAGFNLIKNAL